MTLNFYYEDGQGNVVDENGNEPMDADESDDGIRLENLTNMTSYLACQNKGDNERDKMDLEEEQQRQQEQQKRNQKLTRYTLMI